MAVNRIVPTESQRASSQMHLDNRAAWTYVRLGGVRYIAMPNSTGKRVYMVRADGQGCECPAYQKWGYSKCSHMLAAIEAANHDALEAWLAAGIEPTPAPEPVKAKKSYSDLFSPTCRARGCTDDIEAGDALYCKRHQLVDAF